jgi:hypothetical protein
MTISSDLFLAILAMDSYNRGYAAGLNVKMRGTSLGGAKVEDEQEPAGYQADGFYGVAYDITDADNTGLTDGYGNPVTTVISYRGTDSFFDDPTSGGSDITQGWVAGAGTPTSQTDDAIAFYQEVTGEVVSDNDGPAVGVFLTGHSLGGGLAGLVSTLTGA